MLVFYSSELNVLQSVKRCDLGRMKNGSLKKEDRDRDKTRIKTFISAVTRWICLPFLHSVTNALTRIVKHSEAAINTVT